MLTWERDQFVYVTMSDFIETRDILWRYLIAPSNCPWRPMDYSVKGPTTLPLFFLFKGKGWNTGTAQRSLWMAEELWPLYGQGLMGKDSGLAPRPLRTFLLFATYPFFSNGPLFCLAVNLRNRSASQNPWTSCPFWLWVPTEMRNFSPLRVMGNS